ncbi:MAG TPA: cyclase family protein [Candidatus Sulfomarinibacteraceae bacterium]|nr:cyclase family protein [Candidatus Sulfomarinibacteraceae bacterium]
MPIIDISRTLSPGIAVWPGDTSFQIRRTLSRSEGHSVNLTTLTLSAHTGTHADAPLHFADDGASLDHVDLIPFWGPAQVVTIARRAGALQPDDLHSHDLSLAPRLLLRSSASDLDPTAFPEQYVYPAPALAAHLQQAGIILLGSDAPSMDHVESEDLPGHNALLRHGISILEGLDLSRAPDGLYELSALPLKIAGGDGSPVRAALRPLSQ